MSHSVITSALASAVAPAGTFTAGYPTGKDAGNFYLAMGHKLVVGSDVYYYPVDFDVTLGASSITVTNKTSAVTWPAGATFRLQMEEMGDRSQLSVPMQSPNTQRHGLGGQSFGINEDAKLIPSCNESYLDLICLGAPIAADDNGVCAAQSIAAAGTLSINGALATSGVATFDVPRCVQAVCTGAETGTITVTGTDVYGQTMVETITLNGATTVNGLKAFKTITRVVASEAIDNPVTVGSNNVLGLPVFVPAPGFVVQELVNGQPYGGGRRYQVPFFINQTDLLAPTAANLVSPADGYVVGATAIAHACINTGGNIAVKVGTTEVTGLTITFAGAAAEGTVVSDTPTTPYSATTRVAKGQRIQVSPDASFATAGAVNGFVEVVGMEGIFTPGVRTGGGSTATTGDVRGTYKPSVAPDGSTVFHLVVALNDRYAGIAQYEG